MAVIINTVLPKNVKLTGIESMIVDYMKEVNDELEDDFERTQSTWTHKADWTKNVYVFISSVMSEIWTISDVYRWVSAGTKRHYIQPKTIATKVQVPERHGEESKWSKGVYAYTVPGYTKTVFTRPKKYLRWQSGYNHKSAVGSLQATPGGHYGPWDGRSEGHWISGIQARKFDAELVKQKWREKFVVGAKKVMEEIAKSTGHKAI